MSEVQLTISKDIVAPIVEAKIQEAILAAMGGSEKIVSQVLHEIINKKVDENGQVNSYSSYNKYTWLDVMVTKQIKEKAEQAIRDVLSQSSDAIKDEVAKQLQSKKGSQLAAKALVESLNGTFKNSWRSSIKIDLTPVDND